MCMSDRYSSLLQMAALYRERAKAAGGASRSALLTQAERHERAARRVARAL